jgi:hypothetical protein
MLNARFLTLLGMVGVAAAMRLIPHPPNFTPIEAMALFGGTYLVDKRSAFAVPLLAMYLSDLLLGPDATMPFIYGSIALTVALGFWVRRSDSPHRIGLAALASSIVFFVVSNFGVWFQGGLYPRTLEGLTACYVAAIPFFRNTLAGNALYTILLFGGFALIQRCYPALREETMSMTRS